MEIYSAEQVAEMLQVTRRTLYTYLSEGKLKGVKIGKYWRITDDALKEFLQTGCDPISRHNDTHIDNDDAQTK